MTPYSYLMSPNLAKAVSQAHRLDSPETSSRPHVSSILDDTFYLLKQVLSRALSCGSLSTLRSLRIRIASVMNEDYSGVIRRKMEGVYSASAGQERGVDKERKEKDQREASVVS
jgi:hypothetical protein